MSSSQAAGPSKPPVKPPVVQPGSGNAIVINPCQRLNPVLEHIRNVTKEFGDVVPDFQLGRTTCALFLSLKYHRLHPEYVHTRIQKLGNAFNLRILLLMCDISEHQDPIRELTKICLINNMTIVVCWSAEEAGTYLATYKAFEHKSPDLIKERQEKDYQSILRAALTSINKVNKTDVETLRTTFGVTTYFPQIHIIAIFLTNTHFKSFAGIAKASPEQLRSLPGFGQVKVRRIKDAFEKPFRNNATSAPVAKASSSQASTAREDAGLLGVSTMTESEQQQNSTSTTTPTSPTKSSPRKSAHQFGSAADMPPPPLPRRLTASSPPQDTDELEYVDDDPTTVPRKNSTASTSADGVVPRPRSPSPVWDIELDLNDDD
ncbi:hypothetical protein SCHPADRAFT_981229 [Schizopora paradoxa]|uniref:ERCC1-like central domain-containing protein n=1 Tax=Schizopora paradoxa TaxID=27342 RepID=A0A0H2RBP1_9AGAM|nr:hypothetical protein SCHPADRAFT_981229 [Schizopora paradoxa]